MTGVRIKKFLVGEAGDSAGVAARLKGIGGIGDVLLYPFDVGPVTSRERAGRAEH